MFIRGTSLYSMIFIKGRFENATSKLKNTVFNIKPTLRSSNLLLTVSYKLFIFVELLLDIFVNIIQMKIDRQFIIHIILNLVVF